MDQGNAHSLWAAHSTKIWVLFAAVVTYFFGALGGYAAGIAAALAGAYFWWRLIERPANPTYRQGVVFGFLTQLAAHPLSFLLSGFLGLPSPALGGLPAFYISGLIPSLAELWEILSAMAVFLQFSLIFGSIFTVPLGIIDGLVLVAIRRRFLDDTENQPTESERTRH